LSGRSKKWIKFKCLPRQEAVVGGYTEPRGGRLGFGALLVGYYEGERFKYAGKVGTGFDERALKELSPVLHRLSRRTTPFADFASARSAPPVHWVRPKVVCEVAFDGWTEEGRLKYPRFVAVKKDRDPRQVTAA
ncbi:MAG: ATP-dependent DNA ligase, partial [Deltaproteobacteria bacterium]|nr:ATP-dependent DNA ligase [Deltaproteobacteria bacterium]